MMNRRYYSSDISTMKKEKEEEKQFLIEFIQIYHSLRALWDPNNDDYSNRQKRYECNKVLLKKYREKHPNAEIKDVNKKINVIRTNFRRELRRRNKAISNGVKEEYFNNSSLWYFDELSFIKDIGSPNRSSFDAEDESQSKKQKFEQSDFEDADPLHMQGLKDIGSVYQTFSDADASESNEKIYAEDSQSLNSVPNAFQIAGKLWALKLESMDASQALFAEKLINDVIFKGQLCKLTINSCLSNDDECLPNTYKKHN